MKSNPIIGALALSFIIHLSTCTIVFAQQSNLDSPYTVWQDETQPDSIRLAAYKEYIWNGFLFSQPDSAFKLAEALIDYGQNNRYPKAEAEGYNTQGISHAIQGNHTQALEYYQRSLKIREEIGDKEGIGSTLNNIGNIYGNQGNYPKALSYYHRSLKIHEAIGDKKGIARALGNIGLIYDKQGNSSKALDYDKRSLKINEEIGDNRGISIGLTNIGVIYQNQGNDSTALDYYQRSLKVIEQIGDKRAIADLFDHIGNIYKKQDNYPTALDYIQRSLAIKEEMGNKWGISFSLGTLGSIYAKQGNYSTALSYHQRSLKIREEIGAKRDIAMSLIAIGGGLYLKQGQYQNAITYCKNSLEISKEIGAIVEQKKACQCLYEAYKALDKGNEALHYMELMRIAEDSLNAEETNKKLQQMEFAKQVYQDSVETFEKERLIELAHREEVRKKNQSKNIAFATGGLVLLLAGGLYSRLRYIRKSKAIIESERDRSDNLLLNILPEEIAAELKEKGKADARDFDMVSILFTDFAGFTEHSAKLSAADLVHEINHCFEAFDGIMEKYGIEKIKTIGDAYMAAGGLPVPTDDSVKNTVLAALEMQAFITSRKAAKNAKGEMAFEMRVGIHTGPVVAGIVGVKKFQYDIWGDTVNTASRMESSGEVGKVNISQATYELLKDTSTPLGGTGSGQEFVFESRGKIEAKGKGEINMYFVGSK